MTEHKSKKPEVKDLSKEDCDEVGIDFTIPGGRGNYTADQVAAKLQKKEDQKDKTWEAIKDKFPEKTKK